jgi:hypothetical protein
MSWTNFENLKFSGNILKKMITFLTFDMPMISIWLSFKIMKISNDKKTRIEKNSNRYTNGNNLRTWWFWCF